MKHDPDVWRLAQASLRSGLPCALLYVVESRGSSPGRAGFALIVTADKAAGSIGGGAMEYRFLGEARRVLAEGGRGFLQRQVHDVDAVDASGMICSGEQTLFLKPLGPDDRATVSSVCDALNEGLSGVLRLGPRRFSFDAGASLEVRHRFAPGDDWTYEEDLAYREKLHIVGGGHCALALSKVAADLDFEVAVYDDRPGLPTFEANRWAHRKVLVANYAEIGALIPEGEGQFVCVMTFGYKTDDVALRSLLSKNYAFLGALGSRSKIDRMLSELAASFSVDRLKRLQAPLGLPIHSQTPAEIAVSIAAQLVRTRNDPSRSPS